MPIDIVLPRLNSYIYFTITNMGTPIATINSENNVKMKRLLQKVKLDIDHNERKLVELYE
jgi:hypothetical protein